MNAFNPAHFRAQFPALADAGVYLDSAATALKPLAVIDASDQFYRLSAGNVHRSQFAAAQRLTERYEAARDRVAAWLNAPSGKDIVWTRGTTEAINMVAQSYVRPRLQPGDEIIVSEAEHHANLVPWLMVAGQTGARVVKLPLGADRLPDIASLSALITPRSRVLAIGQMSNVTGGCPDLAQAIRLAHAAGMVVMVDGAQGAVHFPADVQALDIDFYAFSGHKLYGPTGIGALYGKSELLAAMSPWLGGGKMIAEVSFDGFMPQPAPYGPAAGCLRGQRHPAGLFRPLQYPRRCCGAGPRGGSRPGNSGGLMTTLHPFGTTITDATLRQIFAPLNQWEDKYRQLILLGKKLPTLTDERKAQAHEIAGCENRVWLGYEEDAEGRLHFFGDSEGRIVRGLLAVLLTAVEGKTRAGILAQDPLALFDELGLRGQLSASRSQGLSALSEAVLAAARER